MTRWKIIKCQAHTFGEKFDPLIEASRFLREDDRHGGLSLLPGLTLPGSKEPEWAGHIFALIREWAVSVGLLKDDCGFSPGAGNTRYKLHWVESYGVKIIRSGKSETIEGIIDLCTFYIHKFNAGFPGGLDFSDFPESLEIEAIPGESEDEFKRRTTEKLEKFRQSIRSWEEKNNYIPVAEKTDEEKHFRWVALCLVPDENGEYLSGAEIDSPEEAATIDRRVREILKAAGM